MKISNKKAFFNYEVLERFEAGIVLSGAEVKSIRDGRCDLKNSFVKILNDEVWLLNASIARYKYDGSSDYDPERTRKLLITKREKEYIQSKIKQGNLTLVPLSVYTKGDRIKVEFALARGKKGYEKKKAEKEKDLDRDLLYDKREYMV
ncbi:MAG: SsrA-binding protein SmpB [Candidatus Dojkabacteria bacterium]